MSSRARQFAKNSFWLTVATAIVILAGAVYRPIIGRFLGPGDFGDYTFIQTYVNYFLVLALFGVRNVVTRELGVESTAARAYLSAAYRVVALANALALIACIVIGFALRRDTEVTQGILILSLSIVTVSFGDILQGALVAFQRSLSIAAANLVSSLLKLGVGYWALSRGYGLHAVLWTFVMSSIVMTLMNWWSTEKALGDSKETRSRLGLARYLVAESVSFFLLSIASRLYAKGDVLILYLIKGSEVTGLYGAAYVFVDVLLFTRSSIVAVAYPMVARMFRCDEEHNGMGLPEAYERLHKHMYLMFLPVCVLLMCFGGTILELVFGDRFSAGIPALSVLVWTLPPSITALVAGTFLCAVYRQRLNAVLAFVGMGVNVVWTVWFVFLYGAMGAAWSTVGSGVVNAVIHHVYAKRVLGPMSTLEMLVKPIACAGLMLVTILMLGESQWVVRALLGTGAYGVGMLALRVYDSEDRRLMRSVIKKS